jgi:K+/H+ antiporter YhaU regulatory subunit KhtT
VALFRGGRLIPNPKSMIVFEGGDRIAVIGEPEQVAAARAIAG